MAEQRKKSADLPPTGSKNPDPITGAAGAHPIETGVGAALGGAATGMAAGAVAGPIGAVVGAVVGAVAGGYAGKGVGEIIDPTADDTYLNDNFRSRPYVKENDTFDTYKPAYRYGGEAESRFGGKPFTDVEKDVQADYEKSAVAKTMKWNDARPAINDAYERTCQIRKTRGEACNR